MPTVWSVRQHNIGVPLLPLAGVRQREDTWNGTRNAIRNTLQTAPRHVLPSFGRRVFSAEHICGLTSPVAATATPQQPKTEKELGPNAFP
jgi:hypothetical protein